ncbi:MAG: hypothetical protein JST89_12260 [Cyanobacteria bacterium SZAS-4]|nr:hypothetical protein [Cyanobacteria bacterium SZAS-4]
MQQMEPLTQVLYLVIFIYAVYGAMLMVFRKGPPDGWKPETYEKNRNTTVDPFPSKKRNFYDNES